MTDTPETDAAETPQQPIQTSRNKALRVLQKCHAGDIDGFLSAVRDKKKATGEPSGVSSLGYPCVPKIGWPSVRCS